jgi:acetyltransferase-like isoleucine patch superfamily enzyme
MSKLRKLLGKFGILDMHIQSFHPINLARIRALILKITCKKNGWAISVGQYVVIEGKKHIQIGNYSAIGSFVHIWGHGGVYIGERVLIASHTTITSLTHDYTGENVRFGKIIAKPVVIEDDAWIGSHAVIMPGITIGKGAIVGAGAIVTKDVAAHTIVAGSPAKFIKNISKHVQH